MNTQISDVSHSTVAILAGGLGTRLRSVVKEKPKVLASVRNHAFLEYVLDQLNNAHCKKIVLCTGYLGDQIENAFGETYKKLHLFYSPEQMPLGTAGCLKNALPLLHSETILVMNGDSFCAVDLKKFWLFHIRSHSKASVVLCFVSDTSHYGKITLGKDGRIVEFQEKKEGNGKGLVNAGIYLIDKAYIAKIPNGKKLSLEKNIFPHWIGKGLYGYKSNNNFIDIGTPESHARAKHYFAKFKL